MFHVHALSFPPVPRRYKWQKKKCCENKSCGKMGGYLAYIYITCPSTMSIPEWAMRASLALELPVADSPIFMRRVAGDGLAYVPENEMACPVMHAGRPLLVMGILHCSFAGCSPSFGTSALSAPFHSRVVHVLVTMASLAKAVSTEPHVWKLMDLPSSSTHLQLSDVLAKCCQVPHHKGRTVQAIVKRNAFYTQASYLPSRQMQRNALFHQRHGPSP